MNLIYYKESDLPVEDLETMGLAANGQLLLNENDLRALLSGRRTGMLKLKDLEAENIKIKEMDAKLSLSTDEKGKIKLQIHPVFVRPVVPKYLDANETKKLQKGEIANLLKITTDDKGNKKELLVEYDPETREFIVSDTERIITPDMINGEYLTAAQKENYRKGKEVKLPDGTRLQYSGTDTNGIRSNKLALIASLLIDGGMSYMLYRGLNALFGEKHNPKEANNLSPGYHNAYRDMEDQNPVHDNSHIQFSAQSRTKR